MIEVTEELIEAVHRRQMFVTVGQFSPNDPQCRSKVCRKSSFGSGDGSEMQHGEFVHDGHRASGQSPISVGAACRAGLRGHAATSDESRSKERPRSDVKRMCDPWQFALRRLDLRGLMNRQHHIDHMVKLRSRSRVGLDPLWPWQSHWLPCTTEVRANFYWETRGGAWH